MFLQCVFQKKNTELAITKKKIAMFLQRVFQQKKKHPPVFPEAEIFPLERLITPLLQIAKSVGKVSHERRYHPFQGHFFSPCLGLGRDALLGLSWSQPFSGWVLFPGLELSNADRWRIVVKVQSNAWCRINKKIPMKNLRKIPMIRLRKSKSSHRVLKWALKVFNGSDNINFCTTIHKWDLIAERYG